MKFKFWMILSGTPHSGFSVFSSTQKCNRKLFHREYEPEAFGKSGNEVHPHRRRWVSVVADPVHASDGATPTYVYLRSRMWGIRAFHRTSMDQLEMQGSVVEQRPAVDELGRSAAEQQRLLD